MCVFGVCYENDHPIFFKKETMMILLGIYIVLAMFCYHFLTFQEAKDKASTFGVIVFMVISPIYLLYLLIKGVTK